MLYLCFEFYVHTGSFIVIGNRSSDRNVLVDLAGETEGSEWGPILL